VNRETHGRLALARAKEVEDRRIKKPLDTRRVYLKDKTEVPLPIAVAHHKFELSSILKFHSSRGKTNKAPCGACLCARRDRSGNSSRVFGGGSRDELCYPGPYRVSRIVDGGGIRSSYSSGWKDSADAR
jgi:hypothetical protein